MRASCAAWCSSRTGAAVHHANIRVDPTRASRQLDEADPDAGYEGLILRSADFPDGHFLGWTPGQSTPVVDEELAWPVQEGSDLVVQLHLRPTGRVEEVAPTIGFYFTDRPPARRPVMLRLGRQTLAIPAGVAGYRVEDSFVLPVDVALRVVQPHAHFRAREVDAWAALPDGSRQPLLRIADWDARWQDRYRYRAPVRLPAGTRIVAAYVFDNSAANPRNPVQPPALAEWGWRTSDEMGDVWFQMLSAADGDRARLNREARRKMLDEDALGCEVLLRREPDHVPLRNDAGLDLHGARPPGGSAPPLRGGDAAPARHRGRMVQRGRGTRSARSRRGRRRALRGGADAATWLLGRAQQPGRPLDAVRAHWTWPARRWKQL